MVINSIPRKVKRISRVDLVDTSWWVSAVFSFYIQQRSCLCLVNLRCSAERLTEWTCYCAARGCRNHAEKSKEELWWSRWLALFRFAAISSTFWRLHFSECSTTALGWASYQCALRKPTYRLFLSLPSNILHRISALSLGLRFSKSYWAACCWYLDTALHEAFDELVVAVCNYSGSWRSHYWRSHTNVPTYTWVAWWWLGCNSNPLCGFRESIW